MQIIFISNYDQYAVDGHKVNALRYLQKPITEAQVFECMDISFHQWLFRQGQSIVIMDSRQTVRIDPKTILYADASGH